MLNNISWTEYLVAIVLFITVYYLFVGFWFYATEVKEIVSGKRKIFQTVSSTEDSFIAEEEELKMKNPDEVGSADEFADVEQLIKKLKKAVEESSNEKVKPLELKTVIRGIYSEYLDVKKSDLRSSVNELVVSETEKYGVVILTEGEVDKLWDEF